MKEGNGSIDISMLYLLMSGMLIGKQPRSPERGVGERSRELCEFLASTLCAVKRAQRSVGLV